MSPPPLVWFLLLDSATGQPYKETRATKVSVDSSADVADIVEAVKKKFKEEDSTILTGIASCQLVVYKNKATLAKRHADDGKVEVLEEDSIIDGLGTSKKEALIVIVPS
jgi:hypothetical protein